jgi:hypothetical protein
MYTYFFLSKRCDRLSEEIEGERQRINDRCDSLDGKCDRPSERIYELRRR